MATLRLQATPFRKQTWRLRWGVKVWRPPMEIIPPVTCPHAYLRWLYLSHSWSHFYLNCMHLLVLSITNYWGWFGVTYRLHMFSGVVHCLRAQQTTKLHSIRSDHRQRVCVPGLQWKPVWPEWRCNSEQEHSCYCQNRCVHMCTLYMQMTSVWQS